MDIGVIIEEIVIVLLLPFVIFWAACFWAEIREGR